MSYFVYVLYSSSLQKNYIGYTTNLQQRIEAHNHPKNRMWSKRGQPWHLKAYFSFEDKTEAIEAETHLKNLRSPDYIDALIERGWLFKNRLREANSSVG